jgi:hypothetical protein
VVSVVGPIPPYNPGGPVVEVTLNNVGNQPVISLKAVLMPDRGGFDFIFYVTPSNPLQPGKSISVRQTLIGGEFNVDFNYPLLISGTLQNHVNFTYTKQMQRLPPAQ